MNSEENDLLNNYTDESNFDSQNKCYEALALVLADIESQMIAIEEYLK